MMKLKRIFALCMSFVMLATLFVGCGSDADNVTMDSLLQFSELTEGEEVAVITVKDYGDIKVRFFPEEAPKAVENFITHAKNGYYNGLTFHRVIEDFMIQGGDPNGDGSGGESIWGTGFAAEPSNKLYHFRGALCMAQSSLPNSIGSQFYIVQNHTEYTDRVLDNLEARMKENAAYYGKPYTKIPETVREMYKQVGGGSPHLDGDYTVFGHVFDGMDVVDEIAKCAVVYTSRGELSVPFENIVIEKIEIVKYQK